MYQGLLDLLKHLILEISLLCEIYFLGHPRSLLPFNTPSTISSTVLKLCFLLVFHTFFHRLHCCYKSQYYSMWVEFLVFSTPGFPPESQINLKVAADLCDVLLTNFALVNNDTDLQNDITDPGYIKDLQNRQHVSLELVTQIFRIGDCRISDADLYNQQHRSLESTAQIFRI